MKYLITLLLYCLTATAQKPSATAYRVVNADEDGPCSVKNYVKYSNTGFFINYVTAESYDEKLVEDLLQIKEQARNWRSKEFICSDRGVGGELIPNMIVLKNGAVNDTIFTDYTMRWIVFPEERKACYDKMHVLTASFTGAFKEFFEHDFDRQIKALFVPNIDTIPIKNIFYKAKPAISLLKGFKKYQDNFELVSTDSIYNDIGYVYAYKNDTVSTKDFNNFEIKITAESTDWDIDGVKPGDAEEKLLKKYPASTEVKMFRHIRFEDIKRKYYYRVALPDNGSISYYIEDKTISMIAVSLRY